MANDNSISSDLIRGNIDTIILRSLYSGDKNGNEICLDIEEKSGGLYEMKLPTLYSALKRLEVSGYVSVCISSSDVGRRKYYTLTETGKTVCEENFAQWIYSRNIIDQLISDGKNFGYPKPVDNDLQNEAAPSVFIPKTDEEESVPKFNAADYSDYRFIPENFSDDVQNDEEPANYEFNESEVPPLIPLVENSDELNTVAEENETKLSSLHDLRDEGITVTQLSLIEEEKTPDDSMSEDVTEEESVTVEEPEEPVEEEPNYEENGEDDSFKFEAHKKIKRYYSDILTSLYGENKEAPKSTEESHIAEDEKISAEQNESVVQVSDEIEIKPSTLTVEAAVVEEKNVKNAEKIKSEGAKNASEIDYTDIISVVNEQGFKIKTADKTNFSPNGKLLINKLVALSSTVLFFIMLIEMFALCLPFNDVLGFDFKQYLLGTAILFLFPFITYVFLALSPNKTVEKLPTMKYCIAASFVTLLNLILLDFALVLIFQVDLYNAKYLYLYVILPIIAYLNIPLYFIIKYYLLSKGFFLIKE